MPPKNICDLPELFVSQPDGKTVKIGKIQNVQITSDSDYDIYDSQMITPPCQSATFEINWSPSGELIYLLIRGRLPSNNWRKEHGYALKRKMKKRGKQ